MNNGFRSKGFTLIELMIVVAVIGTLAAIAYPAYQDSVRKSRRADAKAVLLEAAQWMERFYTENNRYDQNRAGTAVALPFTSSPKEGGPPGGYYTITLNRTSLTQNTFTLLATPQATGGQDRDPCGPLILRHTGAKGLLNFMSDPNEEKLKLPTCW